MEPSTSRSAPRRIQAIDLVAIAFLWCFSLIIVNPVGNFPLNDDWAYGLTVKHLVETGDFRPTAWTSMPLIANVLWGSLFCLPAGFSFNALRLSTFTLSLIGILGAYVLLREVGQSRWPAVIVALALGFNPIYYALSNTFLTDVPFTAIVILASIFFVRSVRTGSNLDWLVGSALAVAATLSRQLGIAVPLAFAVTLVLKRGITWRNILRAAIPPALCLGALGGFQQWLAATGRLPALYYDKVHPLLRVLAQPRVLGPVVAHNAYVSLLYFGWFLSPVLVFALVSVWVSHARRARNILSAAVGLMAALCLARALRGSSSLMPLYSNVINKCGIGPFTLRDTDRLNYSQPALPGGFWTVITAISLAGAALAITAIGTGAVDAAERERTERMNDSDAAGIFLLLAAIIYLLPLMASEVLDRYLIPVIPLLAGGMASLSPQLLRSNQRASRVAALALLAPLVFFSVCGTKDYLAWNRVRWRALDDLMEYRHVKVGDIDGGFEFNGFYLYNPKYHEDSTSDESWGHGQKFVIAFHPVPGYTLRKEYNYRHWMPPYEGKVVLLEENPREAPKR